jgi:hypothetical protein
MADRARTKSDARIVSKQIPFAQVSNDVMRDTEISLKAKGLYCLIRSYITIPNFNLYKSHLRSKCMEGAESFDSAWRELIKAGYLVQKKYRSPSTGLFTYEYELLWEKEDTSPAEDPGGGFPPLDNPPLENPDLDKPDTDNPHPGNPGVYKDSGSYTHRTKLTKEQSILPEWVQEYQQMSSHDQARMLWDRMDGEAILHYLNTESFKASNPAKKTDEVMKAIASVLDRRGTEIRVGKQLFSLPAFQQTLLDLTPVEVAGAIHSMDCNTQPVSNVSAYILMTLYNSAHSQGSLYLSLHGHEYHNDE